MNEHFHKVDTINKETYTLCDFNINMYLNNKNVSEKCLTTVSNTIPYDVRKYQEFCNFFSLKQFISCPTHISCRSSTIDNILAAIQIEFLRNGSLTLDFLIVGLYFVLGKLGQGHINKSVSAH